MSKQTVLFANTNYVASHAVLIFERRHGLFLILAKTFSHHPDDLPLFSLSSEMEFVLNRFVKRGFANLIFGMGSHRVRRFVTVCLLLIS